MDNDYDEPIKYCDPLVDAEEQIEQQAIEEQEEEMFFDYEDRGMCPVCSMEKGGDVPIAAGGTCTQCGGWQNDEVHHDAMMKESAERGECFHCKPGTMLVEGTCPECGWVAFVQLCSHCQRRPAIFRHRGVIKSDRRHDLCMQCHRNTAEAARQARAQVLITNISLLCGY
jgi:hypothetical protein